MLKIGSMKEAYDLYIRVKIPDTFSYKGMTFERKDSNDWGRTQSGYQDDRVVFSSRGEFASVYWHPSSRNARNFTYYSKGDLSELREDIMKRLLGMVLYDVELISNSDASLFSVEYPSNLIALHEIVQSGSQDFMDLEEYAVLQKLPKFNRVMNKYRSINITREE